jgi:hypothetical protein
LRIVEAQGAAAILIGGPRNLSAAARAAAAAAAAAGAGKREGAKRLEDDGRKGRQEIRVLFFGDLCELRALCGSSTRTAMCAAEYATAAGSTVC